MREDGGKRVTRTPLMVASTVGRKKREMESILAANRTGMADVVHRMISWQRTHVLLNRSVYFFSRGRRDGRTDMVSMENPLASYCLSPSSTAHQEELLANDDFGDYAVDDALSRVRATVKTRVQQNLSHILHDQLPTFRGDISSLRRDSLPCRKLQRETIDSNWY